MCRTAGLIRGLRKNQPSKDWPLCETGCLRASIKCRPSPRVLLADVAYFVSPVLSLVRVCGRVRVCLARCALLPWCCVLCVACWLRRSLVVHLCLTRLARAFRWCLIAFSSAFGIDHRGFCLSRRCIVRVGFFPRPSCIVASPPDSFLC